MKEIKGYEGLYSADESGNIWSHRQRKFLKPWIIGHGYEMVMLYKDTTPKKFLTHRLIALTFVPNPENLREVNHKDGERRNNRPENLEWVTSKENKAHAWKAGLYTHRKLTDEDIREIKRLSKTGMYQKEIGLRFGIKQGYVSGIVIGKYWGHIT